MKKTLSDYCSGDVAIIGYLELLEKRLKPSRFKHTCGVVETAGKMALHHGADLHKTMVAAALHDYAKNMTPEALLEYADGHHVEVDPVMRASAELMHGLVGAKMVQIELGIEDQDVLDAIAYHTIGRNHMSLMEKIVYLADAIELGRTEYPGLESLRKFAYKDLDQGILASVTSTLTYVIDRGIVIHPNSVALYNELVSKYGKSVIALK